MGALEIIDDFVELHSRFGKHLETQRSLSKHSIRAYLGDLESLLQHLQTLGITDISQLKVADIRSWLSNLQVKGGARTSIARRAVSIRLFTKWAAKEGITTSDVGANIATPKSHRTLPEFIDAPSATVAMDALATRVAEEGSPQSLRDCAMVEVLYASGARVGELCGLDLHDIDHERSTIRVFGKGSKERTIPIGAPAMAALKAWITTGRPELSAKDSGAALFLGARGKRIDQRAVRTVVYEALSALEGAERMGPHALRHSAARRWRRSSNSSRNSGTCIPCYYPDLYPRFDAAIAKRLQAGPSARVISGASAVFDSEKLR